MIGTADKSEQIHIQKSELADVRWFSRAEVKAMLVRKQLNQKGLWCPGPYAIAHHLIKHFASGGYNTMQAAPVKPKISSSLGNLALGITLGVAVGATIMK